MNLTQSKLIYRYILIWSTLAHSLNFQVSWELGFDPEIQVFIVDVDPARQALMSLLQAKK